MDGVSDSPVDLACERHVACCICYGFYGPCFEQPLCVTCHSFLYPEDIEQLPCITVTETESGGDSGTEEPTEEKNCTVLLSPTSESLSSRLIALTVHKQEDKPLQEGIVDLLPTEVLVKIFSYLDDISWSTLDQVCERWKALSDSLKEQWPWKEFVRARWPLFNQQYRVKCWKTIFVKLLDSAPCRKCIEQINLQKSIPDGQTAVTWRNKRLRSEMKNLKQDPPEGVQAVPLDRHCSLWQATITGPTESPYEGGLFFLHLQIPSSYPMKPPIVRFMTKIFHPNISRHGDIGLDSIHHNWSLALTISKVLISIQSLLTDPYCFVCMEPEIGNLYMNDRLEFNQIARIWTWKFAMHDVLIPREFTQSKEDNKEGMS
ncbi:uncharacterized protein LOC102800878 [Saccoglossus kowalevskii]|uniref:Ubiquitin-conjugating enzyme E2 O-like n=1 Tax=Saccoglossus kowalevskii TaxID=10224 RepID=A0ABM0MAW2_SACKO|nr:PREDICTED: ubiquitin-conjugating enzyme E2 O-like [Saccoglossus kowalevskii]